MTATQGILATLTGLSAFGWVLIRMYGNYPQANLVEWFFILFTVLYGFAFMRTLGER